MLFRGLIIGSLLTAIHLSPVLAEEELPAGVVNVSLAQFGKSAVGGDYGLANVEPVEVGTSLGRGQEIRIVRTPQDLRLSRRGVANFQVLVGEVEVVYFWIESPPLRGTWKLGLSVIHPDGYRESLLGEDVLREALYAARVPPKVLLEFSLRSSKVGGLRSGNWFRFTVSPAYITLWDGYRPVVLPGQQGLILP